MYLHEAYGILNNYPDVNTLTDKLVYSLIVADPSESMVKIKNLKDEHKFFAIEVFAWCIEFIDNPTDDLQLYALERRWHQSFYIILMRNLERNDETYFNNELKKLKLKYGPMAQ